MVKKKKKRKKKYCEINDFRCSSIFLHELPGLVQFVWVVY